MKESLFTTPVLMLVFNRPEPTQKVFNLLKEIRPKYLYVSADGPRPGKPGEDEACRITREIFCQIDWDCTLVTRFGDTNLGCRYGVSSGISWFFSKVEEGIILEDDCLVDYSFFRFAAELLEKYRNISEVMHISASNFHVSYPDMNKSYYFSLYNHIWGWASWRRAWVNYQVDLLQINRTDFIKTINKLFERSIDKTFWLDIFDYAKSGNINTWDYQWMFAMWHHGGMGITPQNNLVSNIGFGAGGTNTQIVVDSFSEQRVIPMAFPLDHPSEILQDRNKDIFTSDFLFLIKKRARFFNLKIKIASKMSVKFKNKIKKILGRLNDIKNIAQ
jgi:hypothetical protein